MGGLVGVVGVGDLFFVRGGYSGLVGAVGFVRVSWDSWDRKATQCGVKGPRRGRGLTASGISQFTGRSNNSETPRVEEARERSEINVAQDCQFSCAFRSVEKCQVSKMPDAGQKSIPIKESPPPFVRNSRVYLLGFISGGSRCLSSNLFFNPRSSPTLLPGYFFCNFRTGVHAMAFPRKSRLESNAARNFGIFTRNFSVSPN